jgi:hypothetical protein
MTEGKPKEGVYLAVLHVFGYELTAIGRTPEEARNAIKSEYRRKQTKHGPLDDFGDMRPVENKKQQDR